MDWHQNAECLYTKWILLPDTFLFTSHFLLFSISCVSVEELLYHIFLVGSVYVTISQELELFHGHLLLENIPMKNIGYNIIVKYIYILKESTAQLLPCYLLANFMIVLIVLFKPAWLQMTYMHISLLDRLLHLLVKWLPALINYILFVKNILRRSWTNCLCVCFVWLSSVFSPIIWEVGYSLEIKKQ